MHRITTLSLCLLFIGTAWGETALTTVRVAENLTRPVYAASPPGDTSRLFILEKAGRIRILDLDTNTLEPGVFLNIVGLVTGGTSNNDERGLLGLAFDPDFATNGYFYLNYTRTDGSLQTAVVRYQVSGDPNVADPNSAQVLLTYSQPANNHNGGWMGFGPDGYLYIASGDGGGGCDSFDSGQDLTTPLGKLLRVDVSTGLAIAPASNPFFIGSGLDEIWSYGLRNPWRCSFDRVTGDLYIADVGQNVIEEIDFQPAASLGGENYGWDCMEGSLCSSVSGCDPAPTSCVCGDPNLIMPIHEYTHGGSPFRCSITGGYVYRGCAIPDLRGTYFFADYCSEQIWTFRYLGGVTDFRDRTAVIAPSVGTIDEIVSFAEDANGELYIIDQATLTSGTNGEIYKLIPSGAVDAPTPLDYDNDGDTDAQDTRALFDCVAGPDNGLSPCLCDVFDADGDTDNDLRDVAGVQAAITN